MKDRIINKLMPIIIGFGGGLLMLYPIWTGYSSWWLFLSIPVGGFVTMFMFLYLFTHLSRGKTG